MKLRKAKILEITSYPPPRSGWGVRVEFLKKKLEEMGHECVVLNIGSSRKIKSKEYEDVQNGFDYIRKLIRFASGGYTFHAHVNGDSPKGFILTLLAELTNLLFGKRCFLTFHAGINQRFFPKRNSKFLVPLFQLIFTVPRYIICNSQPVKERIMEYRIPGYKIIPIPAFTVQYLQHEAVSLPLELEKFLSSHNPIIFSYIRLREEFHISTLLKGIKLVLDKYPNLGLVMTGVIPEEENVERKMWRLIDELNLKSHIYMLEDMDHDEFRTMMKRSHIYLRTHTRDGVCSSVLEALSFNVPVVASEDGTRPEGVVTYVFNDESDMKEKIEYVLENYNKIKSTLKPPKIEDTLTREAQLLANQL